MYDSLMLSVANQTETLIPGAMGSDGFEVAGRVVLGFLLLSTTGAHPWLLIYHVLVQLALSSPWFAETWQVFATSFSPAVFLFIVAGLLPCYVYWANGFFLLLLEFKWPNAQLRERIKTFQERYKIQKGNLLDVVLDGPSHKPGQLRVLHVVKNLLVGQVFVLLPLAYLSGWLSERDIGIKNTDGVLPSAWEMSADIFGVIVVDEVLFYYGHRLFHVSTLLYKRIHKIHHEFQFPCGLVAAYCHPVEMLASNVLPLGVGLLLLRCNFFTAMVWACAAICGTQTHHSGFRWPYTFPFDDQPDYHDFHHKEFNTNYGLLGWCDALHGTDSKYWEFVKSQKEKQQQQQQQQPQQPGDKKRA